MTSVSTVAASPSASRIERYRFHDDGCIPNSALPVLVYRAVWPDAEDLAARFEALFARHGWTNAWRDGVFDFTHFHSNAHEVLGVAEGWIRVRLGGDHGASVELAAGDVAVLPAGTGHRCEEASGNLLVVGAYPQGAEWDIRRGDLAERDEVLSSISGVAPPRQDPILGSDGPLMTIWA